MIKASLREIPFNPRVSMEVIKRRTPKKASLIFYNWRARRILGAGAESVPEAEGGG
jgi:hypothetical protein